jgi:hypothetical protein
MSIICVPDGIVGSVAAYNLVDDDEGGETHSLASSTWTSRGGSRAFENYTRPFSRDWAIEMLRIISPSIWQSYDSWLRICMAMKSLGMGFETFDSLSREFGGSKYGGSHQTWSSVRSKADNSPGFGTICHYARESDPAAYAELASMPETDPRATILNREIRRTAGVAWRTRGLKRRMDGGETVLLVQSTDDVNACGQKGNERFEGCNPYALVYVASGEVCVCCNKCKRRGKKGFVGRMAYETRNDIGSLL